MYIHIHRALISFYRCHVPPQRHAREEANNEPELCRAGAVPRVLSMLQVSAAFPAQGAPGGPDRGLPGADPTARGSAQGWPGPSCPPGPVRCSDQPSSLHPRPRFYPPRPGSALACPEPREPERSLAARGPGRSAAPAGPWGRWQRPWRAHVGAGPRARRRTRTAVTAAGTGLGPSPL